ncbi:TnsA-like heteromeric transposase endonuclease subunit [Nocardioides lacusdianchii]|uniref:TnsA-like heteromeric transposase endonuclease subunit n=1 Tax=Nocardioides lacusdianchii TaxID=2783664 RepID=UPI001CCD73F4|nr:TnsA-like heteromeric transposase endonuclease subunit [Nocardioides lacusdianchii]
MTRELVTADLADAWPERFESLPPVRTPRAFKGQRNFAGSWWFATTRTHVAFESWLERDHLMLLDFAPEVVAVAAQPFTAMLPMSSGPGRHTPDFFVRAVDGTGVVIDVRPDERAVKDAEVFDATAAACAQVGWGYQRLGDIAPTLNANVRWLSGYRHPRCRTKDVADALLGAVTKSEQTVGTLARLVGDPVVVLPCLFHLLWSGELDAALRTRRLRMNSPVRRARP